MADQGPKPQGLPVVLVVDDEPWQLDAIRWEMGESCELYTAASAAEAEDQVAARRFDVVVCDHMLPGEQGLDFLIRLMEKAPATRRILMTGYTNAEFISRSTVIAELSSCLVKPLRTAEIASAVRAAIGAVRAPGAPP